MISCKYLSVEPYVKNCSATVLDNKNYMIRLTIRLTLKEFTLLKFCVSDQMGQVDNQCL